MPREVKAWQSSDGQVHLSEQQAILHELDWSVRQGIIAFWNDFGSNPLNTMDAADICYENQEALRKALHGRYSCQE